MSKVESIEAGMSLRERVERLEALLETIARNYTNMADRYALMARAYQELTTEEKDNGE